MKLEQWINCTSSVSDMEKECVRAELLLVTLEHYGEMNAPEDGYLMLRNWNLVTASKFTERDVVLFHAKNLLGVQYNRERWRQDLENYRSWGSGIYDFTLSSVDANAKEESFFRKEPLYKAQQHRLEDYKRLLQAPIVLEEKKLRWAAQNPRELDYWDNSKNRRQYHFDAPIQPQQWENPPSKHKIADSYSWESLLESAGELDRADGTSYRAEVMRQTRLLSNKQEAEVHTLKLSEVTNLLGQVGAGKSTMADALAFHIAKQGGKVVFIVNTLLESEKKAQLFQKCGLKAVAMFSRTGDSRKRLVEKIYQSEEVSDSEQKLSLLTQTGCCLEGVKDPASEIIPIGEEPCFALYTGNQQDKKGHPATCPYYGICPTTERDYQLLTSNIIVTTVSGLCSLTIGPKRQLLLDYICDNVNLVIADEADAVQCQMDSVFYHEFAANEYIKSSANFHSDYAKASLDEKTNKVENSRCIKALETFTEVLVEIASRIKNGGERGAESTGFPISTLKAFTSLYLLQKAYKFKEEQKTNGKIRICDTDYKILHQIIGGTVTAEQDSALDSTTKQDLPMSKKLEMFGLCQKEHYPIWTKTPVDENRDGKWKKHCERVLFILLVIQFERSYNKLIEAVSNVASASNGLKTIMRQQFLKQQMLLPSPAADGMLMLRYREQDLYVAKQYTIGRALLYRLPWLRQSPDGEALGPKVLLMSGTSFAPGSRNLNIPLPVDYIVEAPEDKRNFLANMIFDFPEGTRRVSGVSSEDEVKENALKELLEEEFPLLEQEFQEGKNLLIVTNSYRQAFCAARKINGLFYSNYHKKPAFFLQPDSNSDCPTDMSEYAVPRSKLADFSGRILVAPAIVLERGHNIVDNWGNAHFHTLVLAVRPMPVPDSFELQVEKINGAVMQKYYQKQERCGIALCRKIRKNAYTLSATLKEQHYSFKELGREEQDDLRISLFVSFIQLIGRISRVGQVDKTSFFPKVVFLDGAFQSKDFAYQAFLTDYLKRLMQDENNAFAAKTLYEPFYQALTRGEC